MSQTDLEHGQSSVTESSVETRPIDTPQLPVAEQQPLPDRPGVFGTIMLSLFGILLPLITLLYEIITGGSAREFFDPIPTFMHAVLIALVPISNALTLFALRRPTLRHRPQVRFLNGVAIGVSAIYSILFLPLTPLALIGILFLIGFLPLSPAFSFFSTMRLRTYIYRPYDETRTAMKRTGRRGVVLGCVLLVLLELPGVITRSGMVMAVGDSQSTREIGLYLLRTVGSQDMMLRACYDRTGQFDLLGIITGFSSEDRLLPASARALYYRVTGQPFNSVPPPENAMRTRFFDEFEFDEDQGGEAVGGVLKGVSVEESRIEATIDPAAAQSYTEWTLTFRNVSQQQREARAQIALPAGGVVSRATLWIDGEEREAAFGSRGQTREAYEKIVRQSRDPLLVSTIGADRILVQCFPIPPNGGEMKIRIGMVAPLVLESSSSAIYHPPSFIEWNFKIDRPHSLAVSSSAPLSVDGGILRLATERSAEVTGSIENLDLSGPYPIVRTGLAPGGSVVARDPFDSLGGGVRRTVGDLPITRPERLIVVVDGSLGMNRRRPVVADAIERLPEGLDFHLLVASDRTIELARGTGSKGLYREAAERLRDYAGVGGCDNVPTLDTAMTRSAAAGSSVVLWLHGPQPIEMEPAEMLRGLWQKQAHTTRFHDLQFGRGPNHVAQALDSFAGIEAVGGTGDLTKDLDRLFDSWRSGRRPGVSGERIAKGELPASAQASRHLAQLQAGEEVRRLMMAGKSDEAMKHAVRYQLVTPLTGAVVLETAQQYRDAGLKPPASDLESMASGTVPTVPEPETWALLIIASAVIGWTIVKRRTAWSEA